MTRSVRTFISFFMAGSLLAAAYAQDGSSKNSPAGPDNPAANPVAQVRSAKSWELGPFAVYGNGIGDRSDYKFFSVGFQLAKPISRPLHFGPLSGQFEFGGNVMPLWQAYTPAPHQQTYDCSGLPCVLPVGGGTFTGVSITPTIFRWNFLTSSHRLQPWFQGAGGIIYTTHKFPPDVQVPVGTPGGTSVWNFTPQCGIGLHYFTRPGRSIDLGLNALHISSASLGDRNPGVNALVQIQVGYTFWK